MAELNVNLLITAQAVAEAISIEREACAKIVESTRRSDVEDTALRAVAKAIRDRGAISSHQRAGGKP